MAFYDDTNERRFTARRVLMPSSSTITAPQVVRCSWQTVNTSNLLSKPMTYEELHSNKSCSSHPHCKGHLRSDMNG